MGSFKHEIERKQMLTLFLLLGLLVPTAVSNVVLIGKNVSLSFPDVEANFAPPVKRSGESGVLYLAEPLEGCTKLTNEISKGLGAPFVLIRRGECSFEAKVRNAQYAGFKAAIIFDNEDRGSLISNIAVAGNSVGIHIHAVFISMASGETLRKYVGYAGLELWILPTIDSSAWSIVVISFISLLAISAVLAMCFFVRRNVIRHEQHRLPNVREFHGMSSQLVKAMPSLIFTSAVEDNCTSTTCAICLEDYCVGDKLRVLPCRHKFHAFCVDSWLTTWRTFCPVCKRDAMAGVTDLPASERTPLLSGTTPSTIPVSSFHSPVAASPAIRISAMPPWSHSNSRPHSFASPNSSRTMPLHLQSNSSLTSSISHIPNLHSSYGRSPSICISRNSLDLRNSSSHRSRSYLVSPHSIYSPMNSRLGSSYMPGSSNAASSYLAASSSRQSYLRHCPESEASLSALASTNSLPGC
ncbi:receptor homology region, transmembrane domain- and RING domain-containing protein 1-like isoform X1 [Zingiber officinale]|uniref:receptor homology region, transmembrane domain- and RING domain-containing protein 1-like isoform X1 n=1 Tax=Zingiber officinale TaxID=94328 RepID=UPI001C4C3EBF|nr:receptor homology region, transmembrane domain- and RING domain-containing protein 1-like isoform X1 [Zingiber officinale]